MVKLADHMVNRLGRRPMCTVMGCDDGVAPFI
jgi:hypothetical protein